MKFGHRKLTKLQPTPIDSLRGPVAPPPRRRQWPGLLSVALLAAAASAWVVSNHYDPRSLGAKLDAGVAVARDATQSQVDTLTDGARGVADGVARTSQAVTQAVADSSITAAVKAALAADPALSAVRIEVRTEQGVVRLDGPAPDENARRRAEVLAAAPKG